MAVKMLTQRKPRKQATLSYGEKLRALIEEQRVLADSMAKLIEDMEAAEDSRRLDAAIKENAGKPGIPWAEAKKRLGLD